MCAWGIWLNQLETQEATFLEESQQYKAAVKALKKELRSKAASVTSLEVQASEAVASCEEAAEAEREVTASLEGDDRPPKLNYTQRRFSEFHDQQRDAYAGQQTCEALISKVNTIRQ